MADYLTFMNWVQANPLLVALLLTWSLVWKGIGLWSSAQLNHKYWFIAILVINSIGILEIVYLYFVARKYKVEVVGK